MVEASRAIPEKSAGRVEPRLESALELESGTPGGFEIRLFAPESPHINWTCILLFIFQERPGHLTSSVKGKSFKCYGSGRTWTPKMDCLLKIDSPHIPQ